MGGRYLPMENTLYGIITVFHLFEKKILLKILNLINVFETANGLEVRATVDPSRFFWL